MLEKINTFALNYIQEKDNAKQFGSYSKDSYDAYLNEGIPSKKNEAWKYTRLNTFLEKPFNAPESNAGVFTMANTECNKIEISMNSTKTFLLDQGISVRTAKDLTPKDIELLKKEFSNLFEDSIYNLGESFIDGLTLIEISKEKNCQHPIIIEHQYSSDINFHHVFIKASPFSKACILENFNALSDNKYSQVHTKVLAQTNSHIEHIALNSDSNNKIQLINTKAIVKREANYKHINLNLASVLSRNSLNIKLSEEGANCQSFSLYALNEDQHCDNHTLIEHLMPHTESEQLYKALLDDESHGIFNGRIFIAPNAQLCNSNQLNKNLLLSKKSHAHSQPQLEVFADDVKCAHGSTTGQLSEDELFYFLSRGISPKKAKVLLAHGFCHDISSKISNNIIKIKIEAIIAGKLEQLTSVGGN
jgi:Fe-S cluster assembly protein SufD